MPIVLIRAVRAIGIFLRAWTWFFTTAILAAATLLAVLWVPPYLADRITEADVRAQAVLWHRRLLMVLDEGAETFRTGTLTQNDRRYLATISHASEIYRLKLFTADGTVFWSSRASDTGSVSSKPYFQDRVMKGEVYYIQAVKPLSEIDNPEMHTVLMDAMAPSDHHVSEIYTPVVDRGEVIGAVEFYKEFSSARAVLIERLQLAIAVGGTLITLVVGLSVFVITLLNRRQREIVRTKSDREKESLKTQIRLIKEVTLMGELNEWLQSSSSLQELFVMVSRYLSHIIPDAEGEIYIYSNSRDVLDGGISWNGAALAAHIRPNDCWGLRRGRQYAYGSSGVNFQCAHTSPEDERPYFCFPILAHGETVGLMHLRAKPGLSFDDFAGTRKLAQLCGEQISMAISNVRLRDELHDQSVRDPLTGLFNRRHLMQALRRMMDKALRENGSVALVSVDVDHFKKFNDTYGHDAGDMVLRAVGETLEKLVDGDEVACRFGGEEFLLLLAGLSREEVLGRAEALRRAMENVSVQYGEKTLPSITVSVGVAICPEHGLLPQELIKAADDALYRSKDLGRNRVELADPQPETGGPVQVVPLAIRPDGQAGQRPAI